VAIAEAEGDQLLLATGAVEYLHAAAFASADVVSRDRLSLVRTAIQACPPDATALRAHLVAHHARLLVLVDPAGHRTLADEAFRVARESGDSETLAFAREVSLINLVPQEIERYVTIGHELRQMPGRAVLAALPCLAYTSLATGRREALDGAYAQFANLERTHSDRRTRFLLAQILTAQALLDMDEPRLATALRAVHVESPTSEAFATHAAMALWRVHSGRSPRGLPADPPIPEGLPMHALLLSELVSSVIGTMQSDLTARRSLDRLIGKLPPLGDLPRDVLWSSWHAVAAVAAALTGASDLCEDAVRALHPFWDQFVVQGTCVPVGPIGWYLAPALQTLGRHAEALEANHRAEAVSQRLRSPVWLAQCLHQRGKLLRDHHPAIAEESLAQALHLAQSLSMDLLAERVAHTLTTTRTGGQQGHSARQGRSARQRHQGRQEAAPVRLAAPQSRAGSPAFPHHGAAETVGGLTPAAVEILRHAGEGRTNEQISRIMHLSVATVERHLTNAYRALGVRNRTQAVQALLRIDGTEATSK
jgi:ATP/maltotriose-dependent transcriptional regulator MalT